MTATVKTQAELDAATAFLAGVRLGKFIHYADNGCWIWTGRIDRNGYGRASHNGKSGAAHRVFYALASAPTDLPLDHLCRNRACVNPSHLEPVEQAENTRRASASRTHCRHGHVWSESNTMTTRRGHRRCRACNRASCQRRRPALAGKRLPERVSA